jgi:hypothetical protein
MSVRVWLAITSDMPAFCEWFGRRRGGLEKRATSQPHYDFANKPKQIGGFGGGFSANGGSND